MVSLWWREEVQRRDKDMGSRIWDGERERETNLFIYSKTTIGI